MPVPDEDDIVLRIDPDRLRADFDALAAFGSTPAGGVSRTTFSDAHLAAFAIEHGATLYTDDGDFRRFKGLKVQLPLRKR